MHVLAFCPQGIPIDADSASKGVVDKPHPVGVKIEARRGDPGNAVPVRRNQPCLSFAVEATPDFKVPRDAAGIDADDEGQQHEPSSSTILSLEQEDLVEVEAEVVYHTTAPPIPNVQQWFFHAQQTSFLDNLKSLPVGFATSSLRYVG